MRQNRNRIIRFALAAGLLLTTGCTKELESPAGAGYSDVQILAASELAPDNIVGELQSQTRAVADPTKAMTLYLVRADETGKGTDVYDAYSTTPLTATRAAGLGVQPLTFATKQYYLADEVKSRFTGWSPAATSFTGGVASWTLDGSQDILTLAAQTGDYMTPLPDLVFHHVLSQLQFWFYAADAETQAEWGQITKLLVKAQPTVCKYALATDAATGVVTVDATSTADFAATNLSAGALPTVKTQMCNPVMIAPQTAPMVIKLYIETSTGMKVTVLLKKANYLPGQAHKINLKFIRKQVEATATVVPWDNVSTDDQVGKLKVGTVADGGIIYWIDPADATKYKIFSLDEGASLKWSAQSTYLLGAGDGQDLTDGEKNVAAMKAYSTGHTGDSDNTTKTTGVFATDFPAAGFCDKKNTGGVTGWYLPSRDELNALRKDYFANKTLLDNAITASSGTAMTSGTFWSGTEYSGSSDNTFIVNISVGGSLGSINKASSAYVRCVKNKNEEPSPTLELDQNGILTVQGKMLLFKFGSVVGFPQEGAWAADKVLFNPVTGSPSYAAYTSIPFYGSSDYPKKVSDATYHTGANIKAGKGDPCKLVGLTATQIQSMTATQLDAYHSGWRLPTNADNQSFTGQPANNASYTAHWTDSDSRFDKWYYSTGSTGGYFPKDQESQKLNYLPATGYRMGGGSPGSVGILGNYWAGEPMSGSEGYRLCFTNSFVYPIDHTISNYGLGVRCVKDITKIGDLKDDGIVYEVNGTNYKVFSLDQAANVVWSPQNTYVLGAGDGRDVTDGRKNVAAMKAYSTGHTGDSDNTTKTTGVFATDFPAAGFCDKKNTGGVTGWYLPAKDELEALYNAYWANKTVLDAATTANSGTAISDIEGYRGATESSKTPYSGASYVFFGQDYESSSVRKDMLMYVRCIRRN